MSDFIDKGIEIAKNPFTILTGNPGYATAASLAQPPQVQVPDSTVAAPPATLIDPTAMPSLTSSDQRLAKRRAGASQLARKGRASTILTNPDGLGASG